MRKDAALRKIRAAREQVQRQIAASTDRTNKFSVGLAYEGYNGGYIDALSDVELLLNGTVPNRQSWWQSARGKEG